MCSREIPETFEVKHVEVRFCCVLALCGVLVYVLASSCDVCVVVRSS